MLYRLVETPRAWSRGGTLAAAAISGEIALAWFMASQHARLGGIAITCAAACAIGSVIVVARCRMPSLAKAGLIAAGCASWLTWVATQDALGLKRVQASTGTTLSDASAHAGDRVHVRLSQNETGDEQVAAQLQSTLNNRLAGSDVDVAATVSEVGPNADAYRISWSLVRGTDRQWCGDFTDTDRANPDLSMLADRIGDAAQRSRGGALACG